MRAGTDRLRDVWRLPLASDDSSPANATSGGNPAAGPTILGEIAGRRIRITGLLRHPLTALQFLSLLSPAE